MEEYRLYILAGTFLLLVVAFVVLVATVSWSRRKAREIQSASQVPWAAPLTAAQAVDTSLEGLVVAASSDAASASLLTPLRTEAWMPPEEPASANELRQVALSERIAEYQAVPDIREPSFSVEQYPQWEVPRAIGSDLSAQVPEVAVSPVVPVINVPEVAPATPSGRDADTFGAEIAALLPTVEFSAIELEEATAQAAVVAAPVAVEVGASADSAEVPPLDVTVPLEPVVIAQVVPSVVPSVEMPATEPMWTSPAIVVPEPAASAAPVPAPEPAVVPQATAAPEHVIAAAIEDESDAELELSEWVDMLREQQSAETPKAVAPAPAAERPEVRVAVPQPPAPALEPEPMIAEPLAPRPAAQAHPIPTQVEPEPAPWVPPVTEQAPPPVVDTGIVASDLTSAPEPIELPVIPRRTPAALASDVPEVVMAAPVEMWFGDSRIGVKAGTATYDRFRKYADVLLADLQASKVPGR